MLSTKTKEHIRRWFALHGPRWGVLGSCFVILGGVLAFCSDTLRVVEITDTHGASERIITAAQDLDTLLVQTGVNAPAEQDELVITETDGQDNYHILRAYTVPVTVDGATSDIVTTGGTVEDLLQTASIALDSNDIVTPALASEADPGTAITVQRVEYREYSVEETIPVETEYLESSLFYRRKKKELLMREGCDGIDRVTYRETLIDGEVVSTEEVYREPVTEMVPTRIKRYGEGVPVSAFTGPEIVDGAPVEGVVQTFTGQRSTGYSAKTVTAKGSSGRRLSYGTVAVNPAIIPYGSLLYIRSDDGRFVYGYAYAVDTGTAMMEGRAFIDLYYETYEESLVSEVIPVTVYVIDPEVAAAYREANDAILEADLEIGTQ